ncbi:3758_t:CDS:2, partial [Acaulospora colombiana]
MALFGLSAFMFAQINNFFFRRDKYDFLIFIAIATGSAMFFGSWFLIRVPHENDESIVSTEDINQDTESQSGPSISNHESEPEIDHIEEEPLIPKKRRLSFHEPDIGGWELFSNGDALLFGLTMFFLGGTGLMYINNVGVIVKSLYLNLSQNQNLEVSNNFSEGIYSDRATQEIQELQNLHLWEVNYSISFLDTTTIYIEAIVREADAITKRSIL